MLGEALVREGLLHPGGLEEARRHQELTGKDLVECLVGLRLVPEREVLRVLARQHHIQYVTTERVALLKIADEVLEPIPVRVAEALMVMPIKRNSDGTLWVLSPSPLSSQAVERLRREGKARAISVVLARPATIRAAIRRHYYRDPHAFASVDERSLPFPTETEVHHPVETTLPGAPIEDVRTIPDQERPPDITRKVGQPLTRHDVALERENERLRVAQSITASVAQLSRLDELVREFLVTLLDLFPGDGVGFALTGDQGRPLLLETRRRDGDGPAFQISPSMIRTVVGSREVMIAPNVPADPRLAMEGTLIARGVRSVICAPVKSRDGRPMGALYVEARDLAAFTSDQAELLASVAHVAGLAVESVNRIQHTEQQARFRALHERFLSIERAYAAATGASPIDLRPVPVPQGTFLQLRVAPPLRPQSGDGLLDLYRRIEIHVESVCSRVHAHGGVVESVVGGKIGAVFGAPEPDPHHLENALAVALEVFSLAGPGDTRAFPPAIGLATGTMVAGATGKGGQLQYAVLGEPVELAMALAAAARPFELLASGPAQQEAGRFHHWDEVSGGIPFGGEVRSAFRLKWR
jgi:class 3 adenylate cyclase